MPDLQRPVESGILTGDRHRLVSQWGDERFSPIPIPFVGRQDMVWRVTYG